MEQLKKKLKTDDDLEWVDHAKTLREQGIHEDETLLLRRKFFFSDHNVDSRDPVQLNLLYVQARDAIIAGSHPVTIEEASQFAGLQSQIQFGDYIESKHKSGFLDLKEFLPKDYVKNKNVEKRVFVEHRKQIGLSELEAKVKYVQLARSLKTYGVTFFLVKEKMKGKNKLVPRLLGVTKDSVLRLDENTKEIIKTWPLTTVKRWAASPNSFTLDFGDYSDSYYSVQTTEGEQISQLIAGYIDIILKRKKAKDHFGIEGDEGSTMVEDSVSPYKATILQHQTAQKPQLPKTDSIAIPAIMRVADGAKQHSIKSSNHLRQHQVEAAPLIKYKPAEEAMVATITDATDKIMRHQASTSDPNDLIQQAKIVANATIELINYLKSQAESHPEDSDIQNRLLNAVRILTEATVRLVEAAKGCKSNPHEPVYHSALKRAAEDVRIAAETATGKNVTFSDITGQQYDPVSPPPATIEYEEAEAPPPPVPVPPPIVITSSETTKRQEEYSSSSSSQPVVPAVDTIYTATDKIFSSSGDPNELVRLAKILAKATVQLINDLKGQAEVQPDSDIQRRLIVAARLLADATARLVDAAKGCKSNPTETEYQSAIKRAAEDLRTATDSAAPVSSASRRVSPLPQPLVTKTTTSTFEEMRITGDTTTTSSSQNISPLVMRPSVPPPAPPPPVLTSAAPESPKRSSSQHQQELLTSYSEVYNYFYSSFFPL